MSLKWTSYVAPNPKGVGAQKRTTAVFHVKSHFAWRQSATKFLCVKTVSDKDIRHSLAYLFMRKWLVGDVLFYVKIWRILTQHLHADFQSIFACGASAVTPGKKVQLTLIGSPLRAFQCTSVRRLAVAKKPCDCSYSIFARSASAVTTSQSSINTIRKSTTRYQ